LDSEQIIAQQVLERLHQLRLGLLQRLEQERLLCCGAGHRGCIGCWCSFSGSSRRRLNRWCGSGHRRSGGRRSDFGGWGWFWL